MELFAGAGGLALGTSEAGFTHEAVVEWDRHACHNLRENQRRGAEPFARWPLHEGDARLFDYSGIPEDIALVAGGPPCQPFSIGGKHRGRDDSRDMFPEMVRAVRELRPRAIIVENVKGLVRQSFIRYFEYVLFQLSYPEVVSRADETWDSHLSRLERHHTGGRKAEGLSYNVVFRLLNAANYGVPQKRERVFMVGFRSDLDIEWSFPKATHSMDALLWEKWVSGEYWERHGVSGNERTLLPARLEKRIARLGRLFAPGEKPWTTVRDATCDLPDPEEGGSEIPNHRFNPGARSYKGHTGSPLDEPAKTLKAGDHGVPGGENMLLRPDGRVRYLTVRESARLQTFPDEYVFHGSWTETMRQLGNAVPVSLGRAVAKDVATCLRRVKEPA